MTLRTFPALAALVLVVAAHAPALADASDAAREAFSQGVEAFQQGDFETALAKFQAADAASPAPAITYNIARAYEALERPHEAVLAYEAYIAEAGEAGEFSGAATVAIVQLKARSTKLRIDSKPQGASITIDGRPIDDETPVSILVARGTHDIELTLDEWKESRSIEAKGDGSSVDVVFVQSEPAVVEAPAAAPGAATPGAAASSPAASAPGSEAVAGSGELSGLTGSAGLSLSLYRFVGRAEEQSADQTTTATSAPGGVVLGLAFDIGWALSSKTSLLLRGFGGLGSSGQAVASLGAAGPVLSYRLAERWWFGGGLVIGGGRANADATVQDGNLITSDGTVTAETDFALGPSLEVAYAMDVNESGQWLVSLLPTALFTTESEESTLFFPLMLGYRWL